MLTDCYSYGDGCPCLNCDEMCCLHGITDTEKLCDRAREHCERCALEHEEKMQKRGGRQ